MAIWARNTEDLMHNYMYDHSEGYMKVQNAYYRGNSLYSYSTEIARKYPEKDIIIISHTDYSNTTQRQLRYLKNSIDTSKWTVLYADEFDLNNVENWYLKRLNLYKDDTFYKRCKKGVLKSSEWRKNCIDIWNSYIDYLNKEQPEKTVDGTDLFNFVNIQIDHNRKLIENRQKREEELRQKKIEHAKKDIELFKEAYEEYDTPLQNLIKQVGFIEAVQFYSYKIFDNYILLTKQRDMVPLAKYHIERLVVYRALGLSDNYLYCVLFYNMAKDIHYHYMYIDFDKNVLETNSYVTIPLNETTLSRLEKLVSLYKNKMYGGMICRHIGCYEVREANEEHVKVGCHDFSSNAIYMLENDIKLYKNKNNS